jgi:hypothetical protein
MGAFGGASCLSEEYSSGVEPLSGIRMLLFLDGRLCGGALLLRSSVRSEGARRAEAHPTNAFVLTLLRRLPRD